MESSGDQSKEKWGSKNTRKKKKKEVERKQKEKQKKEKKKLKKESKICCSNHSPEWHL